MGEENQEADTLGASSWLHVKVNRHVKPRPPPPVIVLGTDEARLPVGLALILFAASLLLYLCGCCRRVCEHVDRCYRTHCLDFPDAPLPTICIESAEHLPDINFIDGGVGIDHANEGEETEMGEESFSELWLKKEDTSGRKVNRSRGRKTYNRVEATELCAEFQTRPSTEGQQHPSFDQDGRPIL